MKGLFPRRVSGHDMMKRGIDAFDKFKSSDSCIFGPSDLLILVSWDSSKCQASAHHCHQSEQVGFSWNRFRINFLSLLLEFDVVYFCNFDVNVDSKLLLFWLGSLVNHKSDEPATFSNWLVCKSANSKTIPCCDKCFGYECNVMELDEISQPLNRESTSSQTAEKKQSPRLIYPTKNDGLLEALTFLMSTFSSCLSFVDVVLSLILSWDLIWYTTFITSAVEPCKWKQSGMEKLS